MILRTRTTLKSWMTSMTSMMTSSMWTCNSLIFLLQNRIIMAIVKVVKGLKPKFGKHCYLADGAVIVGEVTLGDDVTIWPCAVLRGDVHYIKVGNRSNIQDNSCVHT